MRMARIPALLVFVAAAILAGCGGGGGKSAEEVQIERNLLRLAQGWRFKDIQPFQLYISDNYAFDEQGKADHIASVQEDFSVISNFGLVSYSIDVVSGTLASARLSARLNMVVDVSALDQPPGDYQDVPAALVIEQVWVRDFDGVWRVGAEFTSRAWLLRDTPNIFDISVASGDTFRAGNSYSVSGSASAASDLRITIFPDSVAAAAFQPASIYGFGTVTYSDEFVVKSTALGEYAFTFVAQADRVGQPVMIGRTLRANFIQVDQAVPMAKKRIIPGNRTSMFRLLRIKTAAGRK